MSLQTGIIWERKIYSSLCSEAPALFISQVRYQLMRLKINQVNFYIIDSHRDQIKTDDMQENWKHTCCLQYNLRSLRACSQVSRGKENHGWSVSSSLNTPSFWKKPFHILPCGGQECTKKSSMLLKGKSASYGKQSAQSEDLALFLEQSKLYKPQQKQHWNSPSVMIFSYNKCSSKVRPLRELADEVW